ncbi:MAG: hypothetical protein OEO79_17980 [Gemmatimonadota bacterium]|nr:hypothetical protein [Gemmatimonadota bacterium]
MLRTPVLLLVLLAAGTPHAGVAQTTTRLDLGLGVGTAFQNESGSVVTGRLAVAMTREMWGGLFRIASYVSPTRREANLPGLLIDLREPGMIHDFSLLLLRGLDQSSPHRLQFGIGLGFVRGRHVDRARTSTGTPIAWGIPLELSLNLGDGRGLGLGLMGQAHVNRSTSVAGVTLAVTLGF